ncbi:hypothetical protein J6Y73_02245 [bacterium]|nr:hypothetical protein [bacterium]
MANEQDSLKRSHSASSNFKLTLLCLLASIALMVLVVGLALLENATYGNFALPFIIGGGAVFLLSLFLFSAFKR